jgi:hypothetical protein
VKVLFSRIVYVNEGDRRYFTSSSSVRVAIIHLHLTVVHEIKREARCSTLERRPRRQRFELLVLVTAMDETFSQTVHARVVHARRIDSTRAPPCSLADDGVVEVDLRRFHDVERVDSIT